MIILVAGNRWAEDSMNRLTQRRRAQGTDRRVLILTPYYPPDVSGAGRYVAEAANGLAERGHRVVVMAAGDRDLDASSNPVVTNVIARVRGGTSLAMLWRAFGAHRREPFDVVVCGVAFSMGAFAAILAGVIRRPLVVLAMGEDVAVGDASRIARLGLRGVFLRCAEVVAISRYTDSLVGRLAPARLPRCVIPPGIDPEPFETVAADTRDDFRRRYGLEGRRVVLTVARLEARKGHDTVIAAVGMLLDDVPDVHYLIVGEGDPQHLQGEADRHGLNGRLTVVGTLTADELPVAYAAADVFVMVSRPGLRTEVDGFGIVYLEAAAAGLPCIAGHLGGCADAVVDGVSGVLVDPRDAGEVAAALRTLLTSPARATALGAAGRRIVREHHQRSDSQRHLVDRLLAVASGSRV